MRLLVLGVATFIFCVHGIPQNVTVDDFYGDPMTGEQFTYIGEWHVGQNCTVCFAHPDRNQMYNGTWHDSTTDVTTTITASITFLGVFP